MTDRERFWNKTRRESGGCIEWIGARADNGYGRFWFGGRVQQAHRAAYALLVGEIPAGHDIDHLCRNRGCVNPDHLEPVTRQENLRRGLRGTAKTECPNGHPFRDPNIYYDKHGYRKCRTCVLDRSKARRVRVVREVGLNREPV